MKKVMKLAYLLMGVALLLSSCSEDIFPGGSESNEDVTISLAYSDVSPRDIVVNSRATEAEERHLDNLYIYIFDGNGNLKGYKGIEGEAKLDQKAEITDIKTRSGESYIYAVANYNTGRYPLTVSEGNVEKGKLPINLDQERARAGEYPFTLKDLKALKFQRNVDDQISITDAFLMSGAVNNGNIVNINTAGNITNDDTNDNAIRLSRIVSKVKFTINEKKDDGVNRSFKLANYDIMNIAMNGTLIGSIDGNTKKKKSNDTDVSNIKGLTLGVNDVDKTTGAEYFEAYLPENLQDAKQSVPDQDQAKREDDNMSINKEFTYAPKYGTYVVLKGKYEETTKDGSTKTADVTYYVHLGDCSANPNDYNVERNCKYTFNITVAGVDKIIVEAQKDENDQPGAEGVVLKYGNTGKNLTLDSHYEYMVMRFYKADIKNLKDSNLGYYYQVYALGKKTEPINVKGKANPTTQEHQKQLNGVDTSWIEFAIKGRGDSESRYGSKNDGRGTPCDYPGKKHTMDIETFLKLLYDKAYDKADDYSFWTNGEYIDATCFVSENYYSDLTWDQYVNNVDKRAFYVANKVWVSKDTRSVYAEAQYGLTQHNIQTFYDVKQAGNVIAYGCETINDEEGKNFTDDGIGGTSSNENSYQSKGSDTWNGRENMKKDLSGLTWDNIKSNKALVKACMSRNRDLNGNGTIDDNEIRWYAPAVNQYIGLWIGEEVISTEAKLFNKKTTTLSKDNDPGCRMLYYTSTRGINTYFSEEGMATNNHDGKWKATLIRCVRNLQSNDNDEGYAKSPTKFWTTSNSNKDVELDKVDSRALTIGGSSNELIEHTERSEINKPAKLFRIADKTHPAPNKSTSMQNVVNGKFICNGNYYQKNDSKWRVPNQREMSVMYLIDPSLINYTYCRTKFSNLDFRKSWTYTTVFTMATNWSDYSSGKVRCIKVLK
ncbi:fimbrial protein [Segatella copri]|uniref:DUF4906 domain-containing protein n=1 Tax=Segatella copri TaxID=165179 RepID=UPI003F8B33C3